MGLVRREGGSGGGGVDSGCVGFGGSGGGAPVSNGGAGDTRLLPSVDEAEHDALRWSRAVGKAEGFQYGA